MSKKRFVQAVVARRAPALADFPACVAYAEALWEGLNRSGYGAERAGEPRESRDFFSALSSGQRKSFEGFWEAFDYKKDRNGAAMRWFQLGELSADEYAVIIEAARCEALRALPPGQVRKMAQGWLFEMRWLDFSKTPVDAGRQGQADLRRLVAEHQALKGLYEASRVKDPKLLAQIEGLAVKIKGAQRQGVAGAKV